MSRRRRAVVVGSGPNGLVAALTLARAGWEVVVHEAAGAPGGGLRSAELTLPGFTHDLCATALPLTAWSPVFPALGVELDLVQPDAPLAHPLDGEPAVLVERDVAATARGLGTDAAAYLRLVGPVAAAAAGRPGPAALLQAPAGVSAAHRLLHSRFRTQRARALLAGNAAHSVLPFDRRPSGGVAVALAALAHAVGFPFVRGGSQRLADALVAAIEAYGGEIRCGSPVDGLPHADAVLLDTSPVELLRLAGRRLPAGYAARHGRFRHGPGAFKLDWALAAPIPWVDPACARAGTLHLGGTLREIAQAERSPWRGEAAARPFVLLTQPSLCDPSRAPTGGHTAWAYCHVPHGWDGDATAAIEAQVERFAPGFGALVLARHAAGPRELEARNRNLVGGDVTGGALLPGQLLARPAGGVPWRTPLPGVYLCSASTPPGGGVHGVPGWIAARLALRDGA